MARSWISGKGGGLRPYRQPKPTISRPDRSAISNYVQSFSLSDHDSIEAPLELLTCNLDTPVSVEWSVPLHPSFIHLGIHNLPAVKAKWLHNQMQAYRVSKDAEFLRDVLVQLNAIHDVLVVFNHPLWDEPGVGMMRIAKWRFPSCSVI